MAVGKSPPAAGYLASLPTPWFKPSFRGLPLVKYLRPECFVNLCRTTSFKTWFVPKPDTPACKDVQSCPAPYKPKDSTMLPRKNDEHKTPVVRLGTACGLVGGCGSTTALRSFSLAPRNLRIGPGAKLCQKPNHFPMPCENSPTLCPSMQSLYGLVQCRPADRLRPDLRS